MPTNQNGWVRECRTLHSEDTSQYMALHYVKVARLELHCPGFTSLFECPRQGAIRELGTLIHNWLNGKPE